MARSRGYKEIVESYRSCSKVSPNSRLGRQHAPKMMPKGMTNGLPLEEPEWNEREHHGRAGYRSAPQPPGLLPITRADDEDRTEQVQFISEVNSEHRQDASDDQVLPGVAARKSQVEEDGPNRKADGGSVLPEDYTVKPYRGTQADYQHRDMRAGAVPPQAPR